MLSWDEEATPTAIAPTQRAQPKPLQTGHFDGPAAQLPELVAALAPISAKAESNLSTPSSRRVIAADKRIING